MDVMFVSPRGPKHKYFSFLAAKLAFNSNVYGFSFRPCFRSKSIKLTSDEVSEGIEFHFQRKRV